MSISSSQLKCPACEGQKLDAITVSTGLWHSCPSCSGVFIHQDLIVSLSKNQADTKSVLDGTKSLLLPTNRSCPQCSTKLSDGSARGKGLIFSICMGCLSYWTTLGTLGMLDESIESALKISTENPWVPSLPVLPTPKPKPDDSVFGSIFRTVARIFDSVADQFTKQDPMKPVKASKPTPAPMPKKVPVVPPKISQPKKPQAAPPPQMPPPMPTDWPPIDFPPMDASDYMFNGEPLPPMEDFELPKPIPKVEPPKPKKEVEWKPITAPHIEEELFHAPVPKLEPLPEPKPKVEPKVEPPKPAPKFEPVPAPKPVAPITYVAKKKLSIFDVMKKALEPKPTLKKNSEPAPLPKVVPAPIPKPVPKIVPVPVAKAESTPKQKSAFMQALKDAWAPRPNKSAAPTPKIESAPKPVPLPKVAPVPVAKATPASKPAPAPRSIKEKVPGEPFDAMGFFLPWGLALAFMFLSSFREFGFEGEPATLWSLMGWAIGMFIRTKMMYPFKKFEDASLAALLEKKEAMGWKGLPVSLKGSAVLSDEANPKSVLVYKENDQTIALDRITRWDIIPRLFGLANPGQLLKGDVVITGWFRLGAVPWIEIQEIRAEKITRKSLVKGFRRALPVLLFVFAFVINLSLE